MRPTHDGGLGEQPFGRAAVSRVMAGTAIPFLPHRTGSLVLLAVPPTVLLAGCGGAGAGSDRASTTPPTTRTSTPTTPATSPHVTGIPDDFPLAQGLVSDGETTVSAPRRDVKGVVLEARCWGGAWPGAAVDRLVVDQVGPELGVTRELAVYRKPAIAAAVAEQVRVDADHCHRLAATSQQPTTRSGGSCTWVTRRSNAPGTSDLRVCAAPTRVLVPLRPPSVMNRHLPGRGALPARPQQTLRPRVDLR